MTKEELRRIEVIIMPPIKQAKEPSFLKRDRKEGENDLYS